MKLVSYDRGGQRRLGAIVEGEVVDLPDAVGHPAFPTTLEGLVSSSRGTVMDAARAALTREDLWDHRVKRPRVLVPLFPASLLSPGATDVVRRVSGPEDEVAWPRGAAWLTYEPRVAAVLARAIRRVSPEEARAAVFGYTLVNDWVARDASGAPIDTAESVGIAIGPCVVTADELDPQAMFLQVKVDGAEVLKGNLNGASRSLFELVAGASRLGELACGDGFALGPFRTEDVPGCRLWPGALVELAAEGVGTLRNRIAPPLG